MGRALSPLGWRPLTRLRRDIPNDRDDGVVRCCFVRGVRIGVAVDAESIVTMSATEGDAAVAGTSAELTRLCCRTGEDIGVCCCEVVLILGGGVGRGESDAPVDCGSGDGGAVPNVTGACICVCKVGGTSFPAAP